MEVWVGPVIVAAVVSGLVSAAGWFVTSWQAIRLEQRRRREKVRDFQEALFAEIASDLLGLSIVDREELLATISAQYEADPKFSVVVPHLASNTIYASLVAEIHILPRAVIGPVVDYARLREIAERFVVDLRGDKFAGLTAARQLVMYGDYLRMLGRLEVLAENALAAIDQSLGPSSPGAVPSTRSSGAEPGAAPGGGRDEP